MTKKDSFPTEKAIGKRKTACTCTVGRTSLPSRPAPVNVQGPAGSRKKHSFPATRQRSNAPILRCQLWQGSQIDQSDHSFAASRSAWIGSSPSLPPVTRSSKLPSHSG